MMFFGFSSKWISWISGWLSSAKSSVLVNRSLTDEFHLHRGLRQGESLSLFLFIMIMEGLHVAVEDAILAGYFRGVTVGSQNISHLLFADDVLFLGEWFRSNVINLVNLLQSFYRASGLKLNLQKSKLYGVGVSHDEVQQLALLTGCNSQRLPFVFLGLPISENMAKQKGLEPIVDNFNTRMSRWKASMLSIGVQTTLLSLVLGGLGTYYFSLFLLSKCIIKTLKSLRAQFFGATMELRIKSHGLLGISH
ncbi:RNA-directed DNA polymerase, eukaryota, reverse transcriptase zinc-binding domain protein [Tanacetum coccineum]